MRVIDISKVNYKSNFTTKFFNDSFLLQEKDSIVLNKKKLKFVTKLKPTKKEIEEIEFAFRVCKYVKSNAIVIVKDNSTIGIGAGQQNRLDSSKIASQKARKFQIKKKIEKFNCSFRCIFSFCRRTENSHQFRCKNNCSTRRIYSRQKR